MSAADDDMLAGEFVLGLLDGPERVGAEARAAADPAFAAQVEAWSVQLGPMLSGADVEPPAVVWKRISAQLAANDDRPSEQAGAAVRWWRLAAIGASVVAATLALMLVTRPVPEASPPVVAPRAAAPEPVLVASLGSDETRSAVTISVENAGEQLLVTPVRLPVDTRAPELWIIPGDGTPRSLGLIPAEAATRVPVAAQYRSFIQAGATFAISMEPAGGSPSSAPTGPITASGKITRV